MLTHLPRPSCDAHRLCWFAECLRHNFDGRGSASESDWVVAVSAYVNTSLHAHKATVNLYSDMVDCCVERTDDAHMKLIINFQRWAHQCSSERWLQGRLHAPRRMLRKLSCLDCLEHSDFNPTELLMASHAVAALSAEHEAIFENCCLNCRRHGFKRLANLGPDDLFTAVGLFARAQHVDLHIWCRIAEQIECPADKRIERVTVQLTHCVVPVLSVFLVCPFVTTGFSMRLLV